MNHNAFGWREGYLMSDEIEADLASEQVLLGNRFENAFSRALRTNIRLDEIEDLNEHLGSVETHEVGRPTRAS
jgi:hypothetical protein